MAYIGWPLLTKLQADKGKGRSLVSKDGLCTTFNVLNVALANDNEFYFLQYYCKSKLAWHHLVLQKLLEDKANR